MKDLFISMGDHISVRNFIDGTFTYRTLSAPQIAPLIEMTRAQGGRVRAFFDFGSVPSEKKQRDFRELVDAFEHITGVRLSAEDFLSGAEGQTGETLPNFNFIPTVTEAMNMLAVEYFFSRRDGAEGFRDGFEVSNDTMNFHLFERA